MTSPYPDPGQTNIDSAFSNAEALFAQRRFEEAMDVYTNVLSALETQFGQSHPELAFPLQRLGDCYHHMNRYRESLPIYLRLLSIGETVLGKKHPDMLNLMIKVSKTQELIGSFQDSKKSYEMALHFIGSALGTGSDLYVSTHREYEEIVNRISENKRAADAWREGSSESIENPLNQSGPPQTSPAFGNNPSVPPLPGTGGNNDIEVPNTQAKASAWDNSPPIQQNSSGGVFGGAPPMTNQPVQPQPHQSPPPQAQPSLEPPAYGGAPAANPGGPMPPPQNIASPVPIPAGKPIPPNLSEPHITDQPDWSKSTRPGAQNSPPNPNFPPGGPPQQVPGGAAELPPQQNNSLPPHLGGAPQAPPAASHQNQGQLPKPPPGVAVHDDNELPPWATGPGAAGRVNSVGPVESIPQGDSMQTHSLPHEKRRNDPSNDPYLDHLATRVSDLTPEEEEELIKKSGAWHGADIMSSIELEKMATGTSDQEEEEEDLDEVKEFMYQQKSQKLRATRSAVNKSSNLIEIVRGLQEYLLYGITLIVVVVAGFYFFSSTKEQKPRLVAPRIIDTAKLEVHKHVYVTPDMTHKLILDGIGNCTLYHEDLGIQVTYNDYEVSVPVMCNQVFDSLLERQYWFGQVTDGLVTEHGVMLYSTQSPDWKVLSELRRFKGLISQWYQVSGSFPGDLKQIPKGHFSYVNPYSGKTEEMQVSMIRYAQTPGREIKGQILRGERILNDNKMLPGKIYGYILVDTKSADQKGTAFYIRGVNHHKRFFEISKFGQHLVIGYKNGKYDGNEHITENEPQLYRVEKPTKVWISRMPQIPLGLIHHSLPISLGLLAFFFILRSTMLAPGQKADNYLNKTLRMAGIMLVLLTLAVIVVQFFLWR